MRMLCAPSRLKVLLYHCQIRQLVSKSFAYLNCKTPNFLPALCLTLCNVMFLSQLLSATLNESLKCSCNHLTSFGGSLLVKPNPIDFNKVLVEFKKLDETGNVAVIVTVMVAFMAYFLVLFVARRVDKRDAARVSF